MTSLHQPILRTKLRSRTRFQREKIYGVLSANEYLTCEILCIITLSIGTIGGGRGVTFLKLEIKCFRPPRGRSSCCSLSNIVVSPSNDVLLENETIKTSFTDFN